MDILPALHKAAWRYVSPSQGADLISGSGWH